MSYKQFIALVLTVIAAAAFTIWIAYQLSGTIGDTSWIKWVVLPTLLIVVFYVRKIMSKSE
jgi:hypothetical protein